MTEVRFPDGTIVRASGLPSRDENRNWREFGLYLDDRWAPDWPAVVLDWPDFGIPASREEAEREIKSAFELARNGKRVEVGCAGGIGRTGTVVACMAVLAGVPAREAISWTRKNYVASALEEPEQEEWVLHFAEGLEKHSG